jgi:hypothetical protein
MAVQARGGTAARGTVLQAGAIVEVREYRSAIADWVDGEERSGAAICRWFGRSRETEAHGETECCAKEPMLAAVFGGVGKDE